ncbi:MAG: EAL domain-containing protein [Phormidium sp.]
MAIDVTQRKQAEDLLRRNALYDTLTGLPNRILLMDRIEQSIELLKRNQDYLFAVLFLDLDRFKLINDSLGHEMGDKILIESGKKFSQCVRAVDTVARLGGDEFVLLLQDLKNQTEAIQIAERILTSLQQPILIDSQELFISASIGIAFSSTEISLAPDLLRNADLAMYEAKHQGKACYQIFASILYNQTSRLLELENSLIQALKHQEFILNYQPIVSLTTSNLVGFEALVRWKHPQKGLVSPAEFIPVAEETGLIIPLGDLILSEACRQMKAWQEQFENAASLRMSINISGKQLHQSNCVEAIDQILTATGLKGNSLKLEITESLMIDNRESFKYFLNEMRKRGIQLSIDDFGTGYSSLSYLHRLPFDTIKIDQSFISNISSEENSLQIVKSIINLAHNLSLDTIAEGIETQEQLRILQDLGCDFGQGYFFARPLDAEAVKEMLMDGRIN